MKLPKAVARTAGCLAALFAAAAQAGSVTTTVLENTPDHVLVRFDFAAPQMESVEIDGQKYTQMLLPHEAVTLDAGAPQLPLVARSIILPDMGAAAIRVLRANYYDLPQTAISPSKGNLLRSVDPATVPYTFGPEYAQRGFYPAEIAGLGEVYIQRDYRGVAIRVIPVQYDAAAQTVRIYTDVTVQVDTGLPGGVNELDRSTRSGLIDASFRRIYEQRFINHAQAQLRYSPIDENGSMLIICHDAWLPNVQPLVAHKNVRGIPTTAVGVSTIPGGNTATAIKTYIQNAYNTGDLAYVLLVGDAAQVATPISNSAAADPTYAKLAGGDNYPDAIIGRFSAESTADVDTQVQRTIWYENLPAPTQDWFWRAIGIASNEGGGSSGDEGQSDQVHLEQIRGWLMAFGYTLVDQLYQAWGATAAQVTTAVNAGRGLINYTGHGAQNSWTTTGFSSTNVAALSNAGKLPFIVSVACNNGTYNSGSCFAEAWLRSRNASNQPIGAIAVYMSSISQAWNPPMEGQDEFNLKLCAETYVSYGALCFAGSSSMMDAYGSGGVTEFNAWHIFGDPSVRIAITCTPAGTIALDATKYACEGVATIAVVDCDLNVDDNVVDTVAVMAWSNSEPGGEMVILTELGPATGQFSGAVTLSATNAPGVLWVGPTDTLTVSYTDADNGQGGTNVVVIDTAVLDCLGPQITSVQATDVQPRSAVVTCATDEPARATVRYGLACDALIYQTEGAAFSLTPSVTLTGLQDNTTYYFKVEAVDEAGNSGSDPGCYTFTTPEVPDFFTEVFTTAKPIDLANKKLEFTPNGSVDFYRGCLEPITALPTDPAGGTVLTMTDDNSVAVPLPTPIWLYGVSYSTIYVGANGYITFVSDTDYTETLAEHFNKPRIAAMYDDLGPHQAGQVSWKAAADHVAVTFLNVPKRNAGTPNTFQYQLFFDGRITISYLVLNNTDCIVGLSRGTGLSPDFFESDLSTLGPCQATPPTAHNVQVSTPSSVQKAILLSAQDDGLPNPPGACAFKVLSLPRHGLLRDAGNNAVIANAPYTLVGGGKQVLYLSDTFFAGGDSFTFGADDGGVAPDGGLSAPANVSITVTAAAGLSYNWPLNANPGWTCEGGWEFGQPTGGGSHGGDPVGGRTGVSVYGYVINGDYTNDMPRYYLTTTPIDCRRLQGTQLRFWRWLGIQNLDQACVEVSNNGVNWVCPWEFSGASLTPTAWTQITYDISTIADGQPTVYVRWGMGPTDSLITYQGWNIDDIEIWGIQAPVACSGDANCDGVVSWRDIDFFIAGLNDQATAWRVLFQPNMPSCPFGNLDANADGHVTWRDIDPFIGALNTVCP